ncbi:MAG TPA: pyruvate ferredoxin oxidoreductase [Firmicutes bacterium]|nr:pyruvate ferredoxin oxidoreductase [Bacillota bacterium]
MAVNKQSAAESQAMTGNEALAEAMRQINPDVVAAYPITPATEIVQIFSSFHADGLVDTELVLVESEHSAMSAVIGASAAGARAMTATSSQGLALMHEMLYIASGSRYPIVMPVVNRALSAPLNIHCDHSDTMGSRDAGWVQIYSENAQEGYDNVIQAIRIAEHNEVQVPVMVMIDGFIISHGMENVFTLDDQTVRSFIGPFKPRFPLLDVDNPVSVGPVDFTDFYFEHKRQHHEAMVKVKPVILEIAEEYAKISGRKYGLFEEYMLDDAEVAVVVISSAAGTTRYVVDKLRRAGVKAGMLKLRVFRPFPAEELAEALQHVKAIAVMDRADSLSAQGGPLFAELRSALFDLPKRPLTTNYIYGLGGRDVPVADIESVFNDLLTTVSTGVAGPKVRFLGVRE